MRNRRIILAGGGNEDDSRPLDEIFAAWTEPGGRMLYLPIAMDGTEPTYAECSAWVSAVFGRFGITDIEMWTDLARAEPGRLHDFASVYLGGGNTFRLLGLLRSSGFDQVLTDFVERGGAVYGGSAGAIVLGHDILTAAHLDANDAGLRDTRGLDLAAGHAIWCHYQPDDDPRIAAFARWHRSPMLALSERAGMHLEGGELVACGHEPAFRFSPDGKAVLFPAQRIPT